MGDSLMPGPGRIPNGGGLKRRRWRASRDRSTLVARFPGKKWAAMSKLAQRVRLARTDETQPKNGERLANCGWCWQRFANKLRNK